MNPAETLRNAARALHMSLGKVEWNLLDVVVELLRHLPAGIALLALHNVSGQQVGVNQAGNAASEEVLLHLWATMWEKRQSM